ncbi:B-cell linker protein-like isoform X2 [Stegodyphus dumicola]|uniref:B-cell linker protein-like isoform X2 n=1 Tax=Stegodyphus dumicola TaxID=202533 RepID=UPI0015B153AF|nr:B-cell linker protein-like isoform X2 [Stegodyphus dumicola]
MSTNAENYDTIDDHRENSDDDDSWGSDFDDASVNANYSREIEDNIINEDLEAQLNQVLSLSSENHTSVSEPSSAPAAENTYGNVNVLGNALSAFSYTRSNDISEVSSNRFINKTPGNQRIPALSTPPVQERMAVVTSSHSLVASNEVTERISPTSKNNIPTGCSDNKQTLNQNSELNRGNKTPGKLKADAFAFLKNIPSARSANEDKERKHLVATAFVHAVKLEKQNLSQNSGVNISDEKYEWTHPIPSAPLSSSLSSDTDEEDLRINPHSFHNGSESDNLRNKRSIPTFANMKSRETPEVSKPPLPSRPPPIFALHTGKNAKANTSVTSDKPQIQIPAGRSTKPTPTEASSSLQTGHQRTSVGKLTAVVKEKSLEGRLQESFRPVPLTAPSLYPIIDESSSGNENAATTPPEISLAPPLPKPKPRQSLDTHLSKDENLSTKQNKTEVDINVPKFRRSLGSSMEILSEAKQPFPSSTIIQAANMEQKPKPPKPISPIDDENWPNYLNRPQLPQKLKQTHRSLSCSSLVQSFKEMSFPKRNQSKDKKPFEPSPTPRITEAPKTPQRPSKEVVVKDITRNAWFHDLNAVQAQVRLLNMKQNGAFLVRYSSKPTIEIPYTMCVAFDGRVLNSHIRLKSNGYYALGKEKEGEKVYT